MKLQLQATVFTLLDRKKSQREIQRLTGIARKTIRRYEPIRIETTLRVVSILMGYVPSALRGLYVPTRSYRTREPSSLLSNASIRSS